MKQFFPMARSEIILLAGLVGFAVIAFLPIWKTIELGGMAVFGWLMAILMVVAPVLALLVFRSEDRREAVDAEQAVPEPANPEV